MPSLIPGLEYDVFISYRQKDNKHDGWVTEFVDNLKGELEATFKEDVSVYFDINPHDGLLETHDVDASLKEKLKCAVFIPVISRTYCDPKSFAWVHEFQAFVEQVSNDQLGLKVKLPGGNVANRVLPVQIHDLDPGDKKLVEDELGGFIRGIEFIYREPGVNRPLTPNDDEKKNLSGTKYKNQINKVGNAIREIINGIRYPDHFAQSTDPGEEEKVPRIQKRILRKILAFMAIVALIIVPGYFIIPGLINPVHNIEKSIAVLPFLNLKQDPGKEYMRISIPNAIIDNLCKISSFDYVVPTSYIIQYENTKKEPSLVAKELKVNYLLEGTFQVNGETIVIQVSLINTVDGRYINKEQFGGQYAELSTVQSEISLKVAEWLGKTVKNSERRNIQKEGTSNIKAYELLQQAYVIFGKLDFLDLAAQFKIYTKLAKEATELDTTYAEAYAALGMFHLYSGVFGGFEEMSLATLNALPYIERALELDPDNYLAHFVIGNIYEWNKWDFVRAGQEYRKAFELEPNKMNSSYLLCEYFLKMKQLDSLDIYLEKILNVTNGLPGFVSPELLKVKEFISLGKIHEARKSNLFYFKNKEGIWQLFLGENYIWLNEYDSARKCFEAELKNNNLYITIPRYQACLALACENTGDHLSANKIIDQLKQLSRKTTIGSPDFYIGWYFSGAAMPDSAFLWLEKAYHNRSTEMPWLKADPIFNSLKKDKRYWELYERTGHKSYDDYMAQKKKR